MIGGSQLKNLLIDFQNYIKNNRATFYWILILVIGGIYFSLFAYSTLKPETATRDGAENGENVTLNSQDLTYLNSYYNETLHELEVHFGINSIQSLFSENNLEAKMISQTDISKEFAGVVKKQTPQIITMKFSDVPADYIIAKLTIKYQKPNSDESQTAELYVSHNELIQNNFTGNDYKNISVDFKSSFLVAEIESLNTTLIELENHKTSLEQDIGTLESEDDLLTESEKENIESQIETMVSQIETTNENITEIENEIGERQEQKQEMERILLN